MSSMYKKVGLASLIMMTSVFLSRLTGLIREQVIAYIGGISGGVDAYQVAFIIPEILNHIVASGFLSVTFIPIFSHYLVQNNEEEGWRVFFTHPHRLRQCTAAIDFNCLRFCTRVRRNSRSGA